MNDTKSRRAALAKQPVLNISNEAWREYVYPDGAVLRVVGAIKLTLEKRAGVAQDRHRLIIRTADGQIGMYVQPGWLAVRWQTSDKRHGISW